MRDAREARSQLRSLVGAWLEQTAALRYQDLPARQDPPFASLTFGAAGIAYALYRAGLALGDDQLLERGERWAEAAARHAGRRDGLRFAEGISTASSLAYGQDGIRFVQVLLAQARGDRAQVKARVARFVAATPSRRAGSAELLFGTAGQLLGALVLHEATGDERLRALCDRHARKLMGSGGPPPWTEAGDLALAHGRAGPLYALLRWQRSTGGALPDWFRPALDRLAAEQDAWFEARQSRQKVVLDRTWCNGRAGLTLLWAAAAEQPGWLFPYGRLLGKAARASLSAPGPAGGDLCCGLAGRAYAGLAAARLFDDERLHQQVLSVAADAGEQMRGRWPNGLLKGYPGLVCLALDLVHEKEPRGFPLLEA